MKKATLKKPVKKNPCSSSKGVPGSAEQELETEASSYILPVPPLREFSSPSINPAEIMIERDKVVQFLIGKKSVCERTGHADVTYPGSNHARGVRHIRFFVDGKVVLDIEGDFEDQQFGSNFRFQNMDLYTPGDWEADFLKLTDEFRHHKEKRRNEFLKKRTAERRRAHRAS